MCDGNGQVCPFFGDSHTVRKLESFTAKKDQPIVTDALKNSKLLKQLGESACRLSARRRF